MKRDKILKPFNVYGTGNLARMCVSFWLTSLYNFLSKIGQVPCNTLFALCPPVPLFLWLTPSQSVPKGQHRNNVVLAHIRVLLQYIETLLENINMDGREQIYISHEFYFKACLNSREKKMLMKTIY